MTRDEVSRTTDPEAVHHGGLDFPVERWDEAAFFELRGAWLAVFPRDALAEDAGVEADGDGFDGVTLAHNVGSPDGVDAVLDELVAAGGTLTRPARETDWGGYSGYIADPDGHLWEIAWNAHADLTAV